MWVSPILYILLFFLIVLILQTLLVSHALVSCLHHHSPTFGRFDTSQAFQVGRVEPKVSTPNSVLYCMNKWTFTESMLCVGSWVSTCPLLVPLVSFSFIAVCFTTGFKRSAYRVSQSVISLLSVCEDRKECNQSDGFLSMQLSASCM